MTIMCTIFCCAGMHPFVSIHAVNSTLAWVCVMHALYTNIVISLLVTAAIYVDQLAILFIDSVTIYLQFNIDRGFLVPVHPLPTIAELILISRKNYQEKK